MSNITAQVTLANLVKWVNAWDAKTSGLAPNTLSAFCGAVRCFAKFHRGEPLTADGIETIRKRVSKTHSIETSFCYARRFKKVLCAFKTQRPLKEFVRAYVKSEDLRDTAILSAADKGLVYKLPLRGGEFIAQLLLPVDLNRNDSERVIQYVRTLGQLPT